MDFPVVRSMVEAMTLAPRFLVNLLAGWRVARFERKLPRLGRGVAAQDATFARLIKQLAPTEFGRAHGLVPGLTYAQFREQVPPRTYAYFAPLILRMAHGESGVLTRERCVAFVETANTTGDQPKLLPVPEPMLQHFRQALAEAIYLYAARVGHPGVFLGRHLHIGASTAQRAANQAFCTSLDGVVRLAHSRWADANLYSPPRVISDLAEGTEKNEATAQYMVGGDVTLIAGTPASVYTLAGAARAAASTKKRRMTTLQAMWPNLECYVQAGAPLGLFGEGLREALGPAVKIHEVYAAAEGVFAASDHVTPGLLRLLTDTGLFFEFLPLRDYHEETLPHAGARCLPLEKAEAGVDYVLVVTTPAGLCRYLPGDIVRFTSMDPPRLQFAGRTELHLNTFGEHVTERELFETLLVVCQQHGWHAVTFHVAPYHHRAAAGRTISSHEWWLEFRTHTMKTPTANVIGPALDAELRRRNRDYDAKRASHTLDQPTIRLVVPGVFNEWTQKQTKISNVSKLPHCRPDRLIADDLARFTRFHEVLPANFSTTDPSATMPKRPPDVIG